MTIKKTKIVTLLFTPYSIRFCRLNSKYLLSNEIEISIDLSIWKPFIKQHSLAGTKYHSFDFFNFQLHINSVPVRWDRKC